MTIVRFDDGSFAVNGEFPGTLEEIAVPGFPLTFTDPPYGRIVREKWDDIPPDEMFDLLISWTNNIAKRTYSGGALYMWGGVGTYKNRPFLRYMSEVESLTPFHISTPITWKKKRAYGIQWGYLFTREEIAFMILGDPKKPRKFEVPLLETERGYAGYNEKYPAKSKFYRRTNVWDDVTEIFRGKTHPTEKPTALAKIAILAHTNPGEFVFDPFAGSGSTGVAAKELGRRFVLVERDADTFNKMVTRLSKI